MKIIKQKRKADTNKLRKYEEEQAKNYFSKKKKKIKSNLDKYRKAKTGKRIEVRLNVQKNIE